MDQNIKEQLVESVKNFGFDPAWAEANDVLALAAEAARVGLSVSLVTEVVNKFNKELLQVIVDWINQEHMVRMLKMAVQQQSA